MGALTSAVVCVADHADHGEPDESALMKRALDLLVPPPDRRDVLAHGSLVQLVAELSTGGGGWPQRDSRLGEAGLEPPVRTLAWHRPGRRIWLW